MDGVPGVRHLDSSSILKLIKDAPWLELPAGAVALANGIIATPPAWTEAAGALSSADGRLVLVYLRPRKGVTAFFPSTLVLTLKAGRYSISTWDSTTRARIGLEIATASPLVCGPPCQGSPLFLVIQRVA